MQQKDDRNFRPSNRLRWQSIFGLACGICFSIAVPLSIIKPETPPANRIELLVMCALVFGSMTIIGILMVLFSFGWSLNVKQNQIRARSFISTRHIVFDQETQIQWRSGDTRGRIFITGHGKRIKCELYCFTDDERLALISFFRESIAPESQTGWTNFHQKYFVDSHKLPNRTPASPRGIAWIAGGIAVCLFLKWLLKSLV